MKKYSAASVGTLLISAAALAAAVFLLVSDAKNPAVTDEPEQQEQPADSMEGVSDEIRVELLGTEPETLTLDAGAPQILIYHTHTTEAYTKEADGLYDETTKWRTNDENYNVVRVGEELARELREKYRLSVLHDTTNHEPPYLGTSYERSLKTMIKYQREYPSIKLFIDVHRDAYTLPEGAQNTDFAEVDGRRCARLMFVVGTGEGKTGAGFAIKPHYKENYALALSVTNALEAVNKKLARPVRVKTGRYNQHIGENALLVEMGHNANTLTEALNSVPYLAQSIASALRLRPAGLLPLVPDAGIPSHAPDDSAKPLQLAPSGVK